MLLLLREREADLASDEFDGYLKQGVELARKCGRHEDRGKLATVLANVCMNDADPDGILRWAEVVRESATAAGSRKLDGSYNYLAGHAHQLRAEFDRAHACFENAQRIWSDIRYVPGMAAALSALAGLHGLQGRYAEALECYQECLKVSEELGDEPGRAIYQYNAGYCLQQMGRWEDAAESFYRTVELCESIPASVRGSALNALGELFMDRNWLGRASAVFEQLAHEQDSQQAAAEVVSEAWLDLGRVRRRMGDFAGAASALATALARGDAVGDRRMRAFALGGKAELAIAQGDVGPALNLVASAVAIAAELGLKSDEAQLLRVEGLVRAAMGERAVAMDCFDRALLLFEDSDDSDDAARVRLDYGRFLLGVGELTSAKTHLAAAVRAFRKYAVAADAEEALLLLFEAERESDSTGALLRAVSGLKALGLDPRAYLERALGLLRSAYGLAGAAVLVDDRPIVVSGSLSAAEPGKSGRALVLHLERAGASTRLLLESGPGTRIDRNQVGLDAVADLLASVVGRLVEQAQETLGSAGRTPGLYFRGVRGRDAAMAKVLDAVPALARESTPVVVTGEPGTGKELVALALHESGPRVIRPWVEVDCSIPMHPAREAELFGRQDRAGRLESAHGGTLYLWEVGAADPGLQERLVTLIRDGRLSRVGSSELVAVDLCIVAGTSQSLPEAATQGKFSRSLLDLLCGSELRVPSLRERRDDLEELVLHFIRRCGEEFGRLATGISPEALARLRAHDWPGNITELEAVIERAVLLARGSSMQVSSLPPAIRGPKPDIDHRAAAEPDGTADERR